MSEQWTSLETILVLDQSVLSTAVFIIKSISEDAQQVVAVYLKFPTTLMIQAGQAMATNQSNQDWN